MDLSKLPLNQKTTIIAEKFILATAARINKHEAIISYINLKDRQEVLRILQRGDKNIQVIEYIDDDYWDIYADGKRVTRYDFSVFKNVEVKIKVTTSNKLLEIISLNKGFFQKLKKPAELFFKQRK